MLKRPADQPAPSVGQQTAASSRNQSSGPPAQGRQASGRCLSQSQSLGRIARRRTDEQYLNNQYTHINPSEPTSYPNTGWQHLATHILDYFLVQVFPDLTYLERCKIVVDTISLMEKNKTEWFFLKEDNPLKYMEYLSDIAEHASGHQIGAIQWYTNWIKPGSYYHLSILQREELNYCPHLKHAKLPDPNVQRLSLAALETYEKEFAKAHQDTGIAPQEFQRVRDQLVEMLRLHGMTEQVAAIASITGLSQQASGSGAGNTQASAKSTREVSTPSAVTTPTSGPSEHMPMDVEGLPVASGGGDPSDSWGAIMDRQAQLNEAHESRPWEKEGGFSNSAPCQMPQGGLHPEDSVPGRRKPVR